MQEKSGSESGSNQASDAKAKFREALERKRSQQHAHNEEAQADSKVHSEHSRAGGKRTFRRKSGG